MSLYNNLLPIGNSFIKQEVAGFFNVICDCVTLHRCSNGNFLTPDRENPGYKRGIFNRKGLQILQLPRGIILWRLIRS